MPSDVERRLRGLFGIAIGAVSAAGVAAGAAFDVIGRGEDQIRAVEVVVFRLKRRLRLDGWGRLIHVAILSQK